MAMKPFLLLYTLLSGVITCDVWMTGSFGTVTPNGDVVEPVGSTIQIDCTLSQNASVVSAGDSHKLIWKKDNRIIPERYVRIVDEYTAQLSVPNVTTNDSGKYICLFNSSSENENPKMKMKMVCLNNVEIGYPPLNITDFSCVSPNWQHLICTFTSPPNPVKPKYELEYFRTKHVGGNCSLKKDQRNRDRYICNITNDSQPIYSPVAPRYYFVLKASNRLGIAEFKFVIDHFSRVQPNAPVNLLVTTLNSTVMEVSWERPRELLNFSVGLICRVHYRSEWDQNGVWDSVPDTRGKSVTLNVFSYTEYNITVKCRSATSNESDELWSPNAMISQRTLSDIPGRPPLLVAEGFQDRSFLNSRTIYIFWQAIPPYERRGSNFTYRAVGSTSDENGLNLTITPTDAKENYAEFLYLNHESVYTFEVYSINNAGRSSESSYLTVDSQSRLLPKPEAFTAIFFHHGIYELSWKATPEMNDVVNYTLFWCSNIKPHPFYCQGNLSWIHVDKSVRTHNITLKDDTVNYHFAIAANTATSTSGMVWATCLVPYNGTLNRMKKITLVVNSESKLTVSWKLDCSERIGIVTGFNIYYCPIALNDSTSPCIESEDKLFVNGSHAEKATVTGLEPYTYYKVAVAAVTRAGEGEHSNAKVIRTHETTTMAPAANLTYSNTTNSSVTLEWDLPARPSGQIVQYVIYGGEKPEYLNVTENQTHFLFTLENLNGWVNYKIQLRACISDKRCTDKSAPFAIRTIVGVPGVMGRPDIVNVNETHIMLSLNDPVTPNGPIAYRNLLVAWEVDGLNHSKMESNITQEDIVYETRCGDTDIESATLYFSSQAVNVWEGNILEGDFSPSVPYQCFASAQKYVAYIATGTTLLIIMLCGVLYYCYRRFQKNYKEIQNIKIHLPKGLQSDNLKSDIHFNQPIQRVKSKNVKDLMNETNKLHNDLSRSRNTSGETRISTSSIDELLQRNGEKSGDNSSALGSVSSTQTTRSNLSSDLSCSDVNSLPPTTPDMVFLDNPMQIMKSVPEADGSETGSPKHLPTDADPPASYSQFAQYLGDNAPTTVNGYIQTLPTSAGEHSAYVGPNPFNGSSYSQVGLAAGSDYTNYPSNGGNMAAIPAAPIDQYSQLGLANFSMPSNEPLFGYSAVGLAKDQPIPSNGVKPDYNSSTAEDPCENTPSKPSDKIHNVKPSDTKPDLPTDSYVPMRSHSDNPSPMYSRLSFHQPSSSGYVPPSHMELAMDDKSVAVPVTNNFEVRPSLSGKDIIDASSPAHASKPSTPKKNGYVSLDMMEDKASCMNSLHAPDEMAMKTSRLSEDLTESPGPYSRVVSMTFDDADNANVDDRSLK